MWSGKFTPYSTCTVKRLDPSSNSSFFKFASRENTLSRDQLYIYWLVDHGTRGYIDMPHQKAYEFYVEEKSTLRVWSEYAKFLQDEWEEHLARYPVLKKAAIEKAEKLAQSVRTGGGQDILIKYSDFNQAAYEFCQFLFSPWAVIYCIEPEIHKKMPESIDKIIALDEPIEYQKMKMELRGTSAKKLSEKYGWLNVYNPCDEPYSVKEFERMKAEFKEESLEAGIGKMRENGENFERLAGTIGDEALKRKVGIVHKYAYLKTERIDTWKRLMFLLRGFYAYIAEESGKISLKDSCNLSTSEAIGFLKEGKLPPSAELKLRSQNKALYYFYNKKIEVLYEWEEIQRIDKRLESIRNFDEVKGMPACKGNVEGKARIIRHTDDLKKFREGEVFVAKYTFPSYTPYMAKSAAIITDDGGITSHAAIISREYGIPCVVGTKHATKIFRDGDFVSVDAYSGVVKRVGRAKS
ncbi:MAG: PEP-utilizing enzyme [Candidatus Micrarchaeota archaeon]